MSTAARAPVTMPSGPSLISLCSRRSQGDGMVEHIGADQRRRHVAGDDLQRGHAVLHGRGLAQADQPVGVDGDDGGRRAEGGLEELRDIAPAHQKRFDLGDLHDDLPGWDWVAAKWQAAEWPERAPPRVGRSRAQTSWAIGQRVRKLQPEGIAEELGTSPDSTMRFCDRARPRLGCRRQQRLGIGMMGRPEDLGLRTDLDDASEIHHRHAVGDVTHDGEVVR